MKKESTLVSIIVPVYNVELYLNRCLESIVEQSYSTIEIIIVNDGSTDDSKKLCEEWEKKDGRIVIINQENQGLGPARNKGVLAATGEYIAFVDSDDWVHKDFIKEFMETALALNADIVYCDIYKAYDSRIVKEKYVFEEFTHFLVKEAVTNVEQHPEILYKSGNWTWNKLYRKSLWTRLNISQPAKAVEDICTIFVLLIKAERICHLNKALYYYYQREGSLSYQDSFTEAYIKALEIAEENFRLYEIESNYCYYIGKIFGESLSFVKLHLSRNQRISERIQKMEDRFKNSIFFSKGTGTISGLLFGSFTLRTTLKEVMYYTPTYYGFSSLISAVEPAMISFPDLNHLNHLRASSLIGELHGDFIKNIGESTTSYLFLDFLEERYDIIEIPGMGYLTQSDAFEEAGITLPSKYRIIKNGSDEYVDIWKKSCLKFSEILKIKFAPENVVLIRNRLSECYLKDKQIIFFEDYNNIQRVNSMIEQFEQFFQNCFGGITIISPQMEELSYTAYHFPYGCYPWHLNDGYYIEMGKRVRNALDDSYRGGIS